MIMSITMITVIIIIIIIVILARPRSCLAWHSRPWVKTY